MNINIQEVREAIEAAPHGQKVAIVKRYAERLNISEKTIYRKLGKKRERRSVNKISEEYIREIARLKAHAMTYGKKSRELRTEDAIEIAETRGLIPAGLLKKSTVDRRLRSAGFRDNKPVVRYLEDFCNQAHYIDFSRSEYISIAGYSTEHQDYVLKLDGKSLRYKNKSGNAFSVWVAGLRDGRSGIRHVKYYTVTGENIYMGLDFLQHCWTRPDDEHPLNYIPHYLRIDNGAMRKKKEFASLLEALDIKEAPSLPYNKEAMGKIERSWRTLWQRFELKLLIEKGEGETLLLSDLNEFAFKYTLKEMEDIHSQLGDKKRVIYQRDLMAFPPRVFDGDMQNLASWPHRRKVGRDLTFQIDNAVYQAPECYYEKWIFVHKNLNGDLVGEGEQGGPVFDVKSFKPQSFGQYKSYKQTYREQVQKEALAASDNVVKMKPKEQPIEPDSIHVRKHPEPQVFSLDEAKIYIVQQLHLETYADVSHWFDDLLSIRTDKEAIDQLIHVIEINSQAG